MVEPDFLDLPRPRHHAAARAAAVLQDLGSRYQSVGNICGCWTVAISGSRRRSRPTFVEAADDVEANSRVGVQKLDRTKFSLSWHSIAWHRMASR